MLDQTLSMASVKEHPFPRQNIFNYCFSLGLILYHFLFWREKMGINLLLFSTFLLMCQYYMYPAIRYNKYAWQAAIGFLVSGVMVVVSNTGISKFAHITSFLILTGFIHQPELRSSFYVITAALTNYVMGLKFWKKKTPAFKIGKFPVSFHKLRLALLPIVVALVFYQVYKWANPVFDNLTIRFWKEIWQKLSLFLDNISFGWLLFMVSGALILSGALIRKIGNYLTERENKHPEFLLRTRRKRITLSSGDQKNVPPFTRFKMLALKNEYISGLLLLGLLNMLLLIVNIIDFNWVWLGNNIPTGIELSQFVHAGTYWLIFSILMSMALILYFFRRNQNFYRNNKWLKILAYSWIVQNMILAVSVGLRNYHYISYYGLAYKRIEVMIFLGLTLIGLLTLIVKIKEVRSVFYLIRSNTWAAYYMMIALCFVNWDVFIAGYNINQTYASAVDTNYLLNLSDKTLPTLHRHKYLFSDHTSYKRNRRYTGKSQAQVLRERIAGYLAKQESYSLASWNLADHGIRNYFQNNTGIDEEK